MNPLQLGQWGEEEAAKKLLQMNWRILGRNVRFRCGELDIIACEGNELVVVEVRTRTVGELLPPEDSVGPKKLAKLVRAGRIYVERAQWNGPWRIDLISITVDRTGKAHLEHYRDITSGRVVG